MTRSLRIVTINTGKGDGPYSQRLDLLATGLQQLRPDIVLLQEALATDNGKRHTLDTLAARLDMHASYAPARRKHRLVEGEHLLCSSGLGILTRQAVTATAVVSLPSDPADGERIAQLSSLEWNSRWFLIANIHLSHLSGQDDLRRRQLATLLSHPWFDQNWSARMVGGDLNTPVGKLPTLFDDLSEWTWRDGYSAGGGASDRATVPVNAPSGEGKCIDFILSVSREPASHPRFQDARVVLDEPENGVYPSDHRGVMVSIDIDEEIE